MSELAKRYQDHRRQRASRTRVPKLSSVMQTRGVRLSLICSWLQLTSVARAG